MLLGHKWRARRKILTPTFHFNILQQFVGAFVRQTHVLLKEMEPLCKENEVNISPWITSFTLRTICGKKAVKKMYFSCSKRQILISEFVTTRCCCRNCYGYSV